MRQLTASQLQQVRRATATLPPNAPPEHHDDLLIITFLGPAGHETRLYDRTHLPPQVKEIYRIP